MNFENATLQEIARFVEEHQAELDAEGLTAQEVETALLTEAAVLERREFGFALVQLKSAASGGKIPHLWLLYVDAERRGRGLGLRFVRELVRTHAAEFHMSLYCHGPRRRRFFGKAGFRVEDRDGEMRRMTTNDRTY